MVSLGFINPPIRGLYVINKSDVYRLIVSSKLPAAVEFEKWLFEEVLPAIDETGGYIPVSEEDSPELIMAKALKIATHTIEKNGQRENRLRNKIREKNQIIEENKSKVEIFNKMINTADTFNFREVSNSIKIPEREFIDLLIDYKIVYRDARNKLRAYSGYFKEGWFETADWINDNASGVSHRITFKGKTEMFELFKTYKGIYE